MDRWGGTVYCSEADTGGGSRAEGKPDLKAEASSWRAWAQGITGGTLSRGVTRSDLHLMWGTEAVTPGKMLWRPAFLGVQAPSHYPTALEFF